MCPVWGNLKNVLSFIRAQHSAEVSSSPLEIDSLLKSNICTVLSGSIARPVTAVCNIISYLNFACYCPYGLGAFESYIVISTIPVDIWC